MPLLCSLQVKSMTFSLGCPRSLVDLKDSGDELMPTMSAFLYPVESCRTSAWLLTSPFHGGVDSRGQIRELRVLMSPQSGVLPCAKHNQLAPPSFTQYQPLISGCHVWKTLLSYSHDTSPPTAVCRV